MLKANITNLRETTRNTRRNSGFQSEIAALDPATGAAIVTARIYYPGTVAYCTLWIHGRERYGRGQGKAGGYGYHKPSAALQDAITDAGITLTGDVYGRNRTNRRAFIDGVGDSAMREAIEAIARAVTGRRKILIHIANA